MFSSGVPSRGLGGVNMIVHPIEKEGSKFRSVASLAFAGFLIIGFPRGSAADARGVETCYTEGQWSSDASKWPRRFTYEAVTGHQTYTKSTADTQKTRSNWIPNGFFGIGHQRVQQTVWYTFGIPRAGWQRHGQDMAQDGKDMASI